MAVPEWLNLGLVRKLAVPVGCALAVLVLAWAVSSGLRPTPVTVGIVESAGGEAATTEEATQAVQVWTCSMHPWIRQNAPGRCPICSMELVPVKESGGGLRRFVTSEDAAKLMQIETSPVERRLVVREVRMVGKIDYDETRMTDITAWIAGRLDRLFVDFTGIRVAAGDHMVEIYSPELLAAQEELLQALAAVKELANSNVEEVRRTAEATVQASRDKLRLLGLKADQVAAIEARGKPTDHVTIYAPVGGIVVHKHAQEGAYVKTGAPLYTIADLSHLWVQMDAYESDLPWLAYGQPVEIRSEAYPGDVFDGRVSFISPVLDEMTRTVKVRVNVLNVGDKLKPGMFVRGIVKATVAGTGKVMDPSLEGKWICPMHPGVVSDEPGHCTVCGMSLVKPESLGYVVRSVAAAEAPLVIPASAPLVTGTRAVVYVKDPDAEQPTFDGREIVLGPRAGGYYIVRHGLEEGQQVVTKGNFKIDSALQIQAKPSMMQPEGAGQGGGSAHSHTMPGGETMSGGSMAGETAQAEQMQPVPEGFREYVKRLQALGDEVREAVDAEDVDAARASFSDLWDALNAEPAPTLSEKDWAMWEELSMLLCNDAFEGARVVALGGAERVEALLDEHLSRLGDAFGVAAAPPEPVVEPAAVHVAEFQPILDAYLAFVTDLHADREAEAIEQAAALDRALADAVAAAGGEADDPWHRDLSALAALAGNLQDAEDIAGLRTQLAPLSAKLADMVPRFGLNEKPLYLIHCPMAFDGAGADWLQTDENVRNPYFGGQMPTCGTVVRKFEGHSMQPAMGAGEQAPAAAAGTPEPAAPSQEAIRTEFQPVLDAYLSFVADLAADQEGAAAEHASALAQAVSDAAASPEAQAAGAWQEDLAALARLTAGLRDTKDIAGLRKQLAPLTVKLADIIKQFSPNEEPLYRIHCPMAFSGAGADWLQTDDQVRNPYFGGKMPGCGEVVEKLGGEAGPSDGGGENE